MNLNVLKVLVMRDVWMCVCVVGVHVTNRARDERVLRRAVVSHREIAF